MAEEAGAAEAAGPAPQPAKAPAPGLNGRVPVSMLSGFLGSGKTTLLRHLLENTTQRIGCVVNDVASVNIDAKLIRNDRNRDRASAVNTTSDLADTVELANGCACCSIQDELFASFEQLIALSDRNGIPYDRLVLENSGVAEPQNIRDKFQEAIDMQHPITKRVALDTLITIVDSSSFVQDYGSRTALAARADLGEGGGARPVVDLLVEQLECADFVLLNKVDLLDPAKLGSLQAIAASLNPLAKVMTCEQGRVDLDAVFGPQTRGMVAQLTTEGQHRGAVTAAHRGAAAAAASGATSAPAPAAEADCQACTAGEGPHAEHAHDHKPAAENGHSHSHEHDHKAHEHAHEHSHDHDHAHSHGHGADAHNHAKHRQRQETTAAERFGIRSFVYTRRRPFHPQRLKQMVLRWLPAATNKALDEGMAPEAGPSPIKAVLRSKGFLWLSHSHTTAFYWSHAGQHFEVKNEGDWWAAVAEEDWPEVQTQRDVILSDFIPEHDIGDRRQEIVFIGAQMDEKAICEQLDAALLTEAEFERYLANWASTPDPPHVLKKSRLA